MTYTPLNTEPYWQRFARGATWLAKDDAVTLLKEIDTLRARLAESTQVGDVVARCAEAEAEVQALRDAVKALIS